MVRFALHLIRAAFVVVTDGNGGVEPHGKQTSLTTFLNNTHDDDEGFGGFTNETRLPPRFALARFFNIAVCARLNDFILYLRNNKIKPKER
jgi:hypothetical protein